MVKYSDLRQQNFILCLYGNLCPLESKFEEHEEILGVGLELSEHVEVDEDVEDLGDIARDSVLIEACDVP